MADAERRDLERAAVVGDTEAAVAAARERCRRGECCAHAAHAPPLGHGLRLSERHEQVLFGEEEMTIQIVLVGRAPLAVGREVQAWASREFDATRPAEVPRRTAPDPVLMRRAMTGDVRAALEVRRQQRSEET